MLVAPPTMLISDDDRAFRLTLESVFAPRGFRTLLAGDGDEAMSIVQREPVHLLVTDLHMPRMSGLEIIRQVRRFELEFPCILLSAGVDDQIVEQARDVDAFSVLQKPVRFLEIMQVVRDAMQAAYGWSDNA